MIYNYHRRDLKNIGDMASAPVNYFKFSGNVRPIGLKNEQGEGYPLDGHVIIGGGGLLASPFYHEELKKVIENKTGKIVTWGVGHNRHVYPIDFHIDYTGFPKLKKRVRSWMIDKGLSHARKPIKPDFAAIKEGMDLFDLHGIRDYNYGYNWVPCVSCLHPLLDKYKDAPIQHDFVVYDHPRFMKLNFDPGIPKMENLNAGLEEKLAFISSAETILTSSYHGAYWGMLMGRRVIIVPWATKFVSFKQPLAISRDLIHLERLKKEAPKFPESLEECRQANIKHADKIANLFDVDVRLLNPDEITV